MRTCIASLLACAMALACDDIQKTPSMDDPVLGAGDAGTSQLADSCGDGHLDIGEVCDDGNEVDGDWCESDCTPTCPWPTCESADFTRACNVTAACEARLRQGDLHDTFAECVESTPADVCVSERDAADAAAERILFEDLDWCRRGGSC